MSVPSNRYFAVKTTVGQEKNVARLIEARLAEVLVEEVAEPSGSTAVDDSNWVIQIFESPKNVTVSTVSLYLDKEGELTAPLRIELYKIKEPPEEFTLGEEQEVDYVSLIRDAQLLTNASYDPLLLDKPGWYDIRIPTGVELRRYTVYGVMVKAPNLKQGRYMLHYTENKLYVDGRAFTTSDAGVGWREEAFNILFKVKESTDVASIIILPSVKGYVFIEGRGREAIAAAVQGIRHVKNRPLITVTLDEIAEHLVEKPLIDVLTVGQMVEIVSGPLRGLMGKIIRIDRSKREVTLELTESTYQLPISVSVDSVRILDEVKSRRT
ncbi:MAG TPA: transcription elongation factor Spt5 [Aigarchaeota archaeon]|nr:transcription elongation factor Spt5 [Aigarchaeota archaeon]